MLQGGQAVLMGSLATAVVLGGLLLLGPRGGEGGGGDASNLLASQALACTVVVALCSLTSLTSAPALLLTFPRFFSAFTEIPPGCKPK